MTHAILLLTALLLLPPSHAEGKAKVFILSGQSNMSGGGHVVPEGLRFDPAVGDKVQVWDASDVWNKRGVLGRWASLNELQSIKKEMRMDMIGPEYGFAKAMSGLYPADETRLVKVAKGGTAIDWWLPDAKSKANGHTQLLANLKNALEQIEGDCEIDAVTVRIFGPFHFTTLPAWGRPTGVTRAIRRPPRLR